MRGRVFPHYIMNGIQEGGRLIDRSMVAGRWQEGGRKVAGRWQEGGRKVAGTWQAVWLSEIGQYCRPHPHRDLLDRRTEDGV